MAAAGRQLDLGCLGGQGRRVASGRAETVQPGDTGVTAASKSCSSLSSGISSTSVAGRSGGSASVIANIAGSADSSPMNRCQSAAGDVVIFPRGPMPSILSPARADRTQRSPGPSPCSTMSRVSSRAAVSSCRIV